jgi:hypothetical protein
LEVELSEPKRFACPLTSHFGFFELLKIVLFCLERSRFWERVGSTNSFLINFARFFFKVPNLEHALKNNKFLSSETLFDEHQHKLLSD